MIKNKREKVPSIWKMEVHQAGMGVCAGRFFHTAEKTRCISVFLRFMSVWTYRFRVTFASAWPRISLSVLMSQPLCRQVVAKVCRRA